MDFAKECDDLIAAVTKPLAEGETRRTRALAIAVEAGDVVLCAIDKLDDENKIADLAELGTVAADKMATAAEKLLAARPFVLAATLPTIRIAVPTAVAALGVYSPQVTLLKQAIVPGLQAGDRFFSRLLENLGQ